MEWLVLLAIVIILGALAGADSFGETVRTGCGCLVTIFFFFFVLALFF